MRIQSSVTPSPSSPEPDLIERVCPQCGGGKFERSEKFSRIEWHVGTCADCGFVYLRNVPGYNRMIEEFAWEKSWKEERTRKMKERPITMRLSLVLRAIRETFRKSEQEIFSRLFKPGPLLDVGCGSGERILDGYYTPYGIELSRELCRIANMRMKPRGGFCIHAPAVEGIGQFESGLFTGVILRSFLEHEWKPMELLAGVHRVLRDDGIIFVRASNYASLNRRVRGGQ